MNICYLGDVHVQIRLMSEYFRSRGHTVNVCTFRPRPLPGIEVHSLLDRRLLSKAQYLGALPRLRRLLRVIRPDVIHAFYVTSYGFLGSVLAPERLVLGAMGSDVLIAPERGPLRRWFVKRALSRCRFVQSVAPHLTDRIVALGVPPSRVRTFPPAVDLSRFHPGTSPVQSREPVVICIRKMEPIYNHRVLLQAAPKVLDAHPGTRFVLGGDGSLRESLVRACEETGMAEAFRFLGEVQHENLPDLLRDASVYFSGAVSDGTSASLIEAMGTGVYPVVADIPANRTWIQDGTNGSLFPPNDPLKLAAKLIAALSDGGLRERAAQLNRRIVCERASWDDCMVQLEGIYREIAGTAHVKGRGR